MFYLVVRMFVSTCLCLNARCCPADNDVKVSMEGAQVGHGKDLLPQLGDEGVAMDKA